MAYTIKYKPFVKTDIIFLGLFIKIISIVNND